MRPFTVFTLFILFAPSSRQHAGTAAAADGVPSGRPRLVDVVVRDRNNNIVRGLTEKDFEIREDGQPQDIRAFSFQEINDNAAPVSGVALLGDVKAKVIESAAKPASVVPPPCRFRQSLRRTSRCGPRTSPVAG